MLALNIGRFSPGQIVMTRGVNDRVIEDSKFAQFVHTSLQRHLDCNWGDLCDEDKEMNDHGLNAEEPGRLFSAYEFNGKSDRIWIITEWDRSSTCILFPNEY